MAITTTKRQNCVPQWKPEAEPWCVWNILLAEQVKPTPRCTGQPTVLAKPVPCCWPSLQADSPATRNTTPDDGPTLWPGQANCAASAGYAAT